MHCTHVILPFSLNLFTDMPCMLMLFLLKDSLTDYLEHTHVCMYVNLRHISSDGHRLVKRECLKWIQEGPWEMWTYMRIAMHFYGKFVRPTFATYQIYMYTSISFSKKLAIFQRFTKVDRCLVTESTESIRKLFQTKVMIY